MVPLIEVPGALAFGSTLLVTLACSHLCAEQTAWLPGRGQAAERSIPEFRSLIKEGVNASACLLGMRCRGFLASG